MDAQAQRLLSSAPKAGATVAAQIFFRSLGLLEAATAHSSWIHDFKLEVFNRRPAASADPCAVCRPGAGWTCVKIVRAPLLRAVSSFVHTTEKPEIHSAFTELTHEVGSGGGGSASFDAYVAALRRRAESAGARTAYDDHFMPQASSCDAVRY